MSLVFEGDNSCSISAIDMFVSLILSSLLLLKGIFLNLEACNDIEISLLSLPLCLCFELTLLLK